MDLFISHKKDSEVVIIKARAESGAVIGDMTEVVSPGESAFGMSYDELIENVGIYKLKDKE